MIRSICAIATPYLISERQQSRGYDQFTYNQETRDPQLASIVLLCDSPEGTARDPCQTSPQAQTPPACVILTHHLGKVNRDPGRRRKGHFEICRIRSRTVAVTGLLKTPMASKAAPSATPVQRGSTLPKCVGCIQAIATPPSIANNTTFCQFVSITQLPHSVSPSPRSESAKSHPCQRNVCQSVHLVEDQAIQEQETSSPAQAQPKARPGAGRTFSS